MKSLILRLFCGHFWIEDMFSCHPMNYLEVYGRGVLKPYRCVRCGKKIRSFSMPISYLILLLLFSIASPKVFAYGIYEIGKQYGIDSAILKVMAKVENDLNIILNKKTDRNLVRDKEEREDKMIDNDYVFGNTIITCDECGFKETFDHEETFHGFDCKIDFEGAIEKAKKNGWSMKKQKGQWIHICPDCQGEEQDRNRRGK